jgi:hypothetical protein
MKDESGPKRIFVVPDTQVRPGVPLDHLDWIADSIVHYKPDVVIHIGDHWDFPSLSGHEEPGSAPLEGKRYADDLAVGNEAFARICKPMEEYDAMRRRNKQGKFDPRKIFITGNHETRADRVAQNNPKFIGTIGSDKCDVRGWERYPFLSVVEVEGFLVSHYFQSSHSSRPIGGTITNKLTKIGGSFIHGHVQGLDMGTKMMGSGRTWWGVSAGSCYTHREEYRGNQGQRHWRGVLVLNEVENGECCPMPLSLSYLCRKYEGMPLAAFMRLKYPSGNWDHLE